MYDLQKKFSMETGYSNQCSRFSAYKRKQKTQRNKRDSVVSYDSRLKSLGLFLNVAFICDDSDARDHK